MAKNKISPYAFVGISDQEKAEFLKSSTLSISSENLHKIKNANQLIFSQKFISYLCAKENSYANALTLKNRHRKSVTIRHAVRFLLREYTVLSLNQIGELVGNCDHTTVINSIQKINNLTHTQDKLTIETINKMRAYFNRFLDSIEICSFTEN